MCLVASLPTTALCAGLHIKTPGFTAPLCTALHCFKPVYTDQKSNHMVVWFGVVWFGVVWCGVVVERRKKQAKSDYLKERKIRANLDSKESC